MLQFRRGFKAMAERVSLGIREKLSLSPTDPIDPERICQHLDIDLVPLSKTECDTSAFSGADSDKFSAMTVVRGIRTAIIHNDNHHSYRQRSNICHELAHCFLKHCGCTIVNDNGTRSYNNAIESEAGYLGGALLLPKEAAIHILRSGIKYRAQTLYGVSKPMLEYRLRISGAQTIYERSLAKAG